MWFFITDKWIPRINILISVNTDIWKKIYFVIPFQNTTLEYLTKFNMISGTSAYDSRVYFLLIRRIYK